jgi:hypothetical protein
VGQLTGPFSFARMARRGHLKSLIEIVGWAAAVIIVGAYALLSAGRLDGRSTLYHGLNIVGAVGFVVNSGYNGAFPSAALNVIWIGIGLFGLARSRHRAR